MGQGPANAGVFVYRVTNLGGATGPVLNRTTEFVLEVPGQKGAIVELNGISQRRWPPAEGTSVAQMGTADLGSNPGTITVKIVLDQVGPATLKARDIDSGQEVVAHFQGVP